MDYYSYQYQYGWPQAGPSVYPPPQIPPPPMTERTPTPPLVEIGGLAGESDDSATEDEDDDGADGAGSRKSSSSSGSSDISDTSSSSSHGEASEPSMSSGSGDDYAPEQVTLSKPRRRGRPLKSKVKAKAAPLTTVRRRNNKKLDRPVNRPRGRRTKVAAEGDGEEGSANSVFDMLAESVSKAASANDLGVDDDRFEQVIKGVNDDDEEDFDSRRVYRRTGREHRPTPEVARLLGEANTAYAINGPEEAVDIYLQVVRHDQYIAQAWTSLASCYEELGRTEAARQMRFFAAHVDRDGDKWADLAAEYKNLGQMNQCIYCLTQALRVDPSDVEALWDLASIHRMLDNKLKAVRAFQRLIKHDLESAHNFTLLEEFYPLILETNQLNFGCQAYRAAFDYHVESFVQPDDDEEGNTMGLEHIVPLVDMLMQTEKLEDAVDVVRRGQRWLQGRTGEKHWDALEDDREYAPTAGAGAGDEEEGGGGGEVEGNELETPLRLRLALLRLRLGHDDEAYTHITEILSLDVVAHQDMFVELGGALMKRELWERALDCFAPINEEESIEDSPAVIFSLGVCLHETGKPDQAIEYLRWVIAEDENHLEARLRLANVLEEQGHKAEALDIVTEVLRRKAQQGPQRPAPKMSRTDRAAQRTLTKKMLEDQMRQKMVSLWQEVLEAERALDEGDVGALDMFIQAAGTMIDNHRMAKHMFGRNRGVKLVTKAKLQSQGAAEADVLALQDRLERSLGFEEDGDVPLRVRMTEFYGLNRDDWLSLVVKYCCVLMAKEEYEVALEILEQMVWSAIFYHRRCEVALRLTTIACAIKLKAFDKVGENCRRLSQMHQFRIEPLLLFQAALSGGGTTAHTVWCSLNMQRFIHREMRIYEDAIDARGMHYHPARQRWMIPPKVGVSRLLDEVFEDERTMNEDDDTPVPDEGGGGKAKGAGTKKKQGPRKSKAGALAEALEEEEEVDEEGQGEEEEMEAEAEMPRPKAVSPYWCTVYGQYMLASQSHHGALYYLIRAYEIDPYDSYLCLMIAQAFFGRAMNRQSDNRNYQIAQGLAFLTKYRKLALREHVSEEEVEYNYGRSFHGLGVPHLAVVHYERVLGLVQKRMDLEEHDEMKDSIRRDSLACNAAHNLILLYTATGSVDLVKAKSKWLAI